MFRTAAAINDTAVGSPAVADMGYVNERPRAPRRAAAPRGDRYLACRGRVGGVDVAFKSVDGRCKMLVGRRGRRGTRRQEFWEVEHQHPS